MTNSNLSDDEAKASNCTSREPVMPSFRLNAWLALTVGTYMAMLFLEKQHPDWSPGLKITLCLVPILPGLIYLRKGLELLRGMDELQRRIQFESWLFAAVGTAVVSAIINVFNSHGIVAHWAPHRLEVGATYLMMFCLWSIGVMISNLRYR
ncbi:MAG TPA: hypothetical protein VFE25_14575 [Opitutaceae bacterium]|jgi:hypothetical protein|nr:hypothetical protein [Opitutaceae bacterium]